METLTAATEEDIAPAHPDRYVSAAFRQVLPWQI
jgi:hypothetical protein